MLRTGTELVGTLFANEIQRYLRRRFAVGIDSIIYLTHTGRLGSGVAGGESLPVQSRERQKALA